MGKRMYPTRTMIQPIANEQDADIIDDFKINDGFTITNVMAKLYYYESIMEDEDSCHSATTLVILGKYKIYAHNYDDYKRILEAYTMPIDIFLKDVEGCNTRMVNALKKANINQVSDLISTEPYSSPFRPISKIPGIGKETHKELYRALIRLEDKVAYGEELYSEDDEDG